MFRHIKRIHFVGIGGAGMSGISELLNYEGYEITGSDNASSAVTERLSSIGIKIFEGHNKENVKGADVVVYSSAIKYNNPEVRAARRKRIPCIPRIEILAELMRMKEGIAIAGTHGKTTTTSMVGKILEVAGFDPTIVVGGKLKAIGANVRLSKHSKFLVCEADESDKLFLKLTPVINVITNIDADHLDNYKDMDEIRKIFIKFANLVPFYGCNIICKDDINVNLILSKIKKRYVSYGFNQEANIKIKQYQLGNAVGPDMVKEFKMFPSKFAIQYNGNAPEEFTLFMPGIHNILNACGAIAVGMELEIPMAKIKEAVAEFSCPMRRFEFKGNANGITIMDDYAHHPAEIQTTLEAARKTFDSRVIVIFQPHLFSRTQKLADRFGQSFKDADLVAIMPIYPAREKPVEGITSELIINAGKQYGFSNMYYMRSKDDLLKWCKKNLKKGDTLFTVGAGDIYKFGEEIIKNPELIK
ncbi:MAG: UDP-N-acetylmuramate--L-alanine ligase [bacterium]